MNLFPIEKRFVRYLTGKKILEFSIMSFFEKSRDPRRHGNVGNRLAHRMEALSDSCGTDFRSETPSEEPKSEFCPYRHLFSEFEEN